MTKKIQKWGNSLAIRIPNEYVKALEWKKDSKIEFQRRGKSLVITASRSKYSLDDMVNDMNKKYGK